MIPGVEVGHWTDEVARTGCTVVLLPEGNVTSGEVRGGAPGTREFALLEPSRLVRQVDAVVLAGGSAFGLAACDGVMQWLEEQGRGFVTSAGRVPIVVGMVLFDLAVGDPSVRPGIVEGRAACDAASPDVVHGPIGAGTGLTFAKWRGREHAMRGGLGYAVQRHGDLVAGALVAVNAVGDALDPAIAPGDRPVPVAPSQSATSAFTNTTVGVVATNAILDKVGCHLVAQSAHDGLARALEPAHSMADGDAFVATALGQVEASIDHVRVLAARAVEAAIRLVTAGSLPA